MILVGFPYGNGMVAVVVTTVGISLEDTVVDLGEAEVDVDGEMHHHTYGNFISKFPLFECAKSTASQHMLGWISLGSLPRQVPTLKHNIL